MPANSEKEHLSIVICGHVDSGKSTTTGRLLFELGGIPERELDKLKQEAERLGKSSFAFAFYMDRQKEERGERGVTIACTTKEFFTEKWHYTIIDAPGHRDFIKNMITGASQADVALIMVPADGNFTTAIAKGNHKAGEIQGQTRQHSRLINLLGVKQICIGVNKMDCDTAGYKQERYDEISNEMKSMLIKVGWKKDFIEKNTPVLPISGWMGDNLLKKSENMAWWKGTKVFVDAEEFHVDTLYDVLDKVCKVPSRPLTAPMRMPISGIYKIKGVGDVLAGRVEQGIVKPGEEVIFLPTHTASNPCTGKVFTVEMHHQRVDQACPGEQRGPQHQGSGQEQHASFRRRDGVQEGHHLGPDQGVQRADPGVGHPQRDQSGIFSNWFRAVRSRGVPYFRPQVEDGEGDGWKETRGSSLLEVERDGRGAPSSRNSRSSATRSRIVRACLVLPSSMAMAA